MVFPDTQSLIQSVPMTRGLYRDPGEDYDFMASHAVLYCFRYNRCGGGISTRWQRVELFILVGHRNNVVRGKLCRQSNTDNIIRVQLETCPGTWMRTYESSDGWLRMRLIVRTSSLALRCYCPGTIQFDVKLTHSATRINNSNLLAEQKSSYYEHCVGASGLYSLWGRR